ncbi:MAG: hypothetical protein ACLUOF_10710 [Ruminococcus sp.]
MHFRPPPAAACEPVCLILQLRQTMPSASVSPGRQSSRKTRQCCAVPQSPTAQSRSLTATASRSSCIRRGCARRRNRSYSTSAGSITPSCSPPKTDTQAQCTLRFPLHRDIRNLSLESSRREIDDGIFSLYQIFLSDISDYRFY